MDNLNIHCEKSVTDTFGRVEEPPSLAPAPRAFYPKHGSWLNRAWTSN
jgi:hypothetical protein